MAMALLLHGGLLGGMGGEAAGVDGSGEGAWTLATPAEGFLAASGTGELAHLLHLCLFRAWYQRSDPDTRFRIADPVPPNSMLDEVLSVQEEPASLEGVVLTNCHTGAWS